MLWCWAYLGNSPSLPVYPTLVLNTEDGRFNCPAGSSTWLNRKTEWLWSAVWMEGVCLLVYILGTKCAGFALSV